MFTILACDLTPVNWGIANEILAGYQPTGIMKTCLRAVTHRQRKRHTVEQIIKVLCQVDEGCAIESACREHNISQATFHRWRRKYGRMEVKDAKRLKELEKENTELKKIVTDQVLNTRVLEAVNTKKW